MILSLIDMKLFLLNIEVPLFEFLTTKEIIDFSFTLRAINFIK